MAIITALLFLYIVSKPFYFWASGLPQISDIILVVAFAMTFLTYKPKEIGKIISENIHFFIFLVFVLFINFIYSVYYGDLSFDLKSVYYFFDALGIIVFSIIFDKNPRSKVVLRKAFMVALIIQLCVFLAHLGRYYGGFRYMGTFNDPNQYAYFCLLSYSFIYLLSKKENRLNVINFAYLILTIFLIVQSSSTGMLLGVTIFIALFLIGLICKLIKNLKRYLSYIFIISVIATIIGCIIMIIPSTDNFMQNVVNSKLLVRLEEKTAKASGEGEISLWEERGYDRIAYYPHYVIYGSGEGKYERFEKAYHHGELHATLPSILFCYGLVPCYLVIVWGYKKLKNQKIDILCIYIALLFESFTLINSRQVLFWVLFCVSTIIRKDGE